MLKLVVDPNFLTDEFSATACLFILCSNTMFVYSIELGSTKRKSYVALTSSAECTIMACFYLVLNVDFGELMTFNSFKPCRI